MTAVNKKEYMEQFLAEEEGIKPPVGFWQHFVDFADHHTGLTDPETMPRVLAGQKAFIDQYEPDFIKIMSDGFFSHPSMLENQIDTVADLAKIKAYPADHPWFTEQVKFVREIRDYAGDDIMLFYSIFSPMNYIRLRFEEVEKDNEKFPRLFMEDPEQMKKAIEVLQGEVIKLVELLLAEDLIDGFYYSVQSVQDDRADDSFHEEYVAPSDLAVAQAMQDGGAKILLHICGWGEFTNPLERYVDYPADFVNWATHAEKMSLKEGKKLFKKPVLGGFDNNPGTLIYTGTKEELKEEVYRLLDETAEAGVAIGADCTLGEDLEAWRISYVQELVKEYYAEKIK